MNTKSINTFSAVITFGLEIGYSKQHYDKQHLINKLQEYQKQRIDEASIYLSASVSECNIVLSGQDEKHIKLEFINYPKFPLEIDVFKKEIIRLVSYMLNALQQNRTVIVFPDETIMLENDEAIDPRI